MDTITEPHIAILVPQNQTQEAMEAKLFGWLIYLDTQGNMVFKSPSGKETKILAN